MVRLQLDSYEVPQPYPDFLAAVGLRYVLHGLQLTKGDLARAGTTSV